MEYSWENNDLWEIRVTEEDYNEFEQPYIGNGIMGCRIDKLVAGTDKRPIYVTSRTVYDDGKQLFLPSWNNLGIEIDGVLYKPENGKHDLEQIMNLRNAVVSMKDNWEYKSGKTVCVEIETFIPRTFGQVSYTSLSIKNITEAGKIEFGLLGSSLSDCYQMEFSKINDTTIIGYYQTNKQKRHVSQALSYKQTGLTNFKEDISQESITIGAITQSENIRLELFHSISSYEESADTYNTALSKVRFICDLGRERLMSSNLAEWKKLWRNGLAFRNNNFQWEKSVIVHQFYLLCSLEDNDYPLGPLGLSSIEWDGNQLWDGDFWLFRAVLPLWPDFAKAFVKFRKKSMEGAKKHAHSRGYEGAWYGWQTNESGDNITILRFNDELHINIWIALAAWEYYVFTKNSEYLKDTAWPIISEIANFFVSRSELENDGYYHINFVIGPDEAVCECGQYRVDDNFLTNYGVKKLMEIACISAETIGMEAKSMWKKLKDSMYLLKPDANCIIPEYEGYYGAGIKQADVILSFYPLGYKPDIDTIRKNIKFYRDKQMYYGPLMSSQIESCIMMQLGDKEGGLKRLFAGMQEFTKGKHYIPFECRDNDKNVMLTGIGGELQAIIFGYYGADLENVENIPRMSEYMD